MKRLFIQLNAAILLLLATSSLCMGADTYTLEYKLENGKSYKQSMLTTTVMKMDLMGQEMSIDIISEMGIQYDVLGQNDGMFDIRVLYKKIKMSMSAPMSMEINIDADSPENSSENKAFKLLTETPLDIQLTKQGKVASVKGTEAIAEKLNTLSNQQLKEILSQQLSEKGIKILIEQMLPFLPDKPVAIGESWDLVQNLNSNGADIINKMKLTLKQVKDNIATLDCSGTLTTPEGGAVMQLQGMDATVSMNGLQSGTILIDVKTGWIARSELTINSLQEIDIMGQLLEQVVETKTIVTPN